jgi:hypothetical protein
MADRINIKGTSDGLIITLGAGAWQGLVEEVEQRLSEKASRQDCQRLSLGAAQLSAQSVSGRSGKPSSPAFAGDDNLSCPAAAR